MSRKEQKRAVVLGKVDRGELTGEAAAQVMGLSIRQVRRLLASYRREGPGALAHGNRGRRPAHSLDQATRERILELAQTTYQGFNHQHLTEKLQAEITVSRSTVRRILLGAGIKSPKKRRAPKHRSKRERYPQEGMLIQVDGSRHDWLEGRGPYLSLILAVDDATGTVPYAVFRDQEDAHGYFLLLWGIIERKGLPLALYTDKHSIFKHSVRQKESVEEELRGERAPTQFGRALKELAIEDIFAQSPQAKGRVERLGGTFQDRLVSELRLAGARTIEEANCVLAGFLPCYNDQFGVPAAREGSAYRTLEAGLKLEEIFCFKYQRIVASDNTIRLDGQVLQLPPGPNRLSYAHAKVELQQRLDGSLVVRYADQIIGLTAAPPQPVTLRADKLAKDGNGAPGKVNLFVVAEEKGGEGQVHNEEVAHPQVAPTRRLPSADHPWRKWVVTKSLNT